MGPLRAISDANPTACRPVVFQGPRVAAVAADGQVVVGKRRGPFDRSDCRAFKGLQGKFRVQLETRRRIAPNQRDPSSNTKPPPCPVPTIRRHARCGMKSTGAPRNGPRPIGTDESVRCGWWSCSRRVSEPGHGSPWPARARAGAVEQAGEQALTERAAQTERGTPSPPLGQRRSVIGRDRSVFDEHGRGGAGRNQLEPRTFSGRLGPPRRDYDGQPPSGNAAYGPRGSPEPVTERPSLPHSIPADVSMVFELLNIVWPTKVRPPGRTPSTLM